MRLLDWPYGLLVLHPLFVMQGRSSLFLACRMLALGRPGAPVSSFFLAAIFGKVTAWSPKLVSQVSGLRSVLVRCCVEMSSSSCNSFGVAASLKLCRGGNPESQCCVGVDGVMRVC